MRTPLVLPGLAELSTKHEPPDVVVAELNRHGVNLSPATLATLGSLVGLVDLARPYLNVTAIREPEQLWGRLVLDALLLLPSFGNPPAGTTIVDVGCGGGFPGLPLAIAAPHCRFTLVDATAKKIAFVKHVVQQLELPNVSAIAGRAEQLTAAGTRSTAAGPLREQFEWVTARAVAALPQLLELTSPFAQAPAGNKAGGQLLLVKGEGADEELRSADNAQRQLKVALTGRERVSTATLLCYRKTAPTPPQYPRANGMPKRQPL